MNNYQIELNARHRPEVLERILRVIRHRGFTVTTMQMELIEDKVRLK
ncbi:acetolactate synthase 2 small subunit, partial [Rodentibacter caecimuris]